MIAVHGVGDQQPFDTVREIGDLLQSLSYGARSVTEPPPACFFPKPENPVYYPFREHGLRIDVRPVVVTQAGATAAPEAGRTVGKKSKKVLGPFNHWVGQRLKAKQRVTDKDDIQTEFKRGQLRCYGGEEPENTYQTLRLEGTRAPFGGAGRRDVHIYEMYWADLSRLKAGIWSVFTELYQLLFHLSSLGVHTVNAAAAYHADRRSWRCFSWLQGAASTALTVAIPALNLSMLGIAGVLASLCAICKLSAQRQTDALMVVGAVLITVLIGLQFWRMLADHRMAVGVWLLGIVPLIAAAGWIATHQSASGSKVLCPVSIPLQVMESVVAAALSAVLIWLLLKAYDKRRPGALKWSKILAIVALVAGLITMIGDLPDEAFAFWARLFDVVFRLLELTWIVFVLLTAINLFAGAFAVFELRKADRDLGRRSWWTGSLMLALPSAFFAMVTISAWWLVLQSLAAMVPQLALYETWKFGEPTQKLGEFLKAMFNGAPILVLASLAVATGIAAIPAIWGLIPVVLQEIRPPETYESLTPPASTRTGKWLTFGFTGLWVAGCILYFSTVFGVPVLVRFSQGASRAMEITGGISGAAFALLLLMRGSWRKLVLGFRTILDILLDVDNWLREHPLNNNPAARICGRYVSLLRYICEWKDSSGEPYDALLIIAHSQGTVISADLLRFLQKESGGALGAYDPELARLDRTHITRPQNFPVFLLTMGCPLRQLYGLRFPYLYKWARHDNVDSVQTWVTPDLLSPNPNPTDMGVDFWENLYRSGDYIGRYLWRSPNCGYVWNGDHSGDPVAASVSTDSLTRLEFCIGSGAHTHYWDKTGTVVANELDRLIACI